MEEEASSVVKYTEEVTRRLLFLKKLDGYPVIRDLVSHVTISSGFMFSFEFCDS